MVLPKYLLSKGFGILWGKNAAGLKKTVVSLLGSVGPPVLKNKLVYRETFVLSPSQDPDGLRFAIYGFPDRRPDVALVGDDFTGLGEVEISPPGVAVVERELDGFPPAMLVLLGVIKIGAGDVADNDCPLKKFLETCNILKSGAGFVDSGLPLFDLLAPFRVRRFASPKCLMTRCATQLRSPSRIGRRLPSAGSRIG